MKKLCDYLGCEVFKCGKYYYSTGIVYAMCEDLSALTKAIEDATRKVRRVSK